MPFSCATVSASVHCTAIVQKSETLIGRFIRSRSVMPSMYPHHQQQLVARGENVVDAGDARVIQRGCTLRFFQQAGRGARIVLHEPLDRDRAFELGVLGAIHLAHAAGAKALVDDKASDHRAREPKRNVDAALKGIRCVCHHRTW